MASTLPRPARAGGKGHRNHGAIADGFERNHRPESPLRIDAEIAMNVVASMDDAIRTALRARNTPYQSQAIDDALRAVARARRELTDGFAFYEIPDGPRGRRRQVA